MTGPAKKDLPQIECLGPHEKGGWYTVIDDINSNSVIYSFGIGDNASWDLAMIEKFGCVVHAFDPTPDSVAWVAKQDLPQQFRFNAEGLSTYDGEQRFYNAFKPGKVDMSAVRPNSRGFYNLPVKRLQTCMDERGHDHIDVLKIDVEGLEYEVLPTILDLDIRQLLVELHSNFFRLGGLKTRLIIVRLWFAGFRLVKVDGHDYVFYNRRIRR